MNRPLVATGITLVIVGIFALLGASGVLGVTMQMMWPFSILVPGLYFEIGFFLKRGKLDGDVLIPAAMMIVYAVLFLASAWGGRDLIFVAWPVFPLGAALGFLQAYYFGNKNILYLITGQALGIFSLLGLIFVAAGLSTDGVVFPILVVVLGILAIVQAVYRKQE